MSDTLPGGRRFRTLNILDEGARKGLAIEVVTSLPSERVIRILDHVAATFYTRRRRHSTPGALSPVEFEQRASFVEAGVLKPGESQNIAV